MLSNLYCCIACSTSSCLAKLSLDTMKPVIAISYKLILQPVCSVTGTSHCLGIKYKEIKIILRYISGEQQKHLSDYTVKQTDLCIDEVLNDKHDKLLSNKYIKPIFN